MRSRLGYVSNSSSSSFVVYGDEAGSLDEALGWIGGGEKVICVSENSGHSGENADVVFTLTPERLKVFEKGLAHEFGKGYFHIIRERFSGFVDDDCLAMDLPGLSAGSLFYYKMDYCSPAGDSEDDPDFVSFVKESVEEW